MLSECEENFTTQEAILIDSILEQFEAQKKENNYGRINYSNNIRNQKQ